MKCASSPCPATSKGHGRLREGSHGFSSVGQIHDFITEFIMVVIGVGVLSVKITGKLDVCLWCAVATY